MARHLLPLAALLLGSGFLFFAGGMNALLLPVRGGQEGFSTLSLGLLGTGWAFGFVTGCLVVSKLVARVGHIRSYSVMAALASLAVLTSLLLLTPYAWVPLRALSGFCFAGAAMIVESWLNEQVDSGSRGKVFGVYQMVNLTATTAGQMVLTLGDTRGYLFFVVAAMVYSLALIPTAVSSSRAPKPLVATKLNLKELWVNSPVAVVSVVLLGASNSAFGTLAAVYAGQVGLPLTLVALFVAMPVLASAVIQVPIGALSDRVDRRFVMIGMALLAILADILFITFVDPSPEFLIGFALMFGMAIFTLFPLAVAHANDHATPDSYVRTSGGLLLLFGLGSIVGPLMAGAAMGQFGPSGLFMVTLATHIGVLVYTIYRISRRASVAQDEKSHFAATPTARNTTPQTTALRTGDDVYFIEDEFHEVKW
ncbi:MAG: MFS transporter [Rhizobiales bacterium]|nr:MFS transporter [Hyphomicrobiales bacterium]MBO6698368.1 MFS transporter [Hyphomicrobiales bacterium]MBO6735378.1 MFS transporter [Hyphomicrobiales bacterium]MBO6910814.1 MFS transporter [Hyphomicrobiales bacterium]MBO6957252.1 MFS transporter [Hyphomicrobiales bacterium]